MRIIFLPLHIFGAADLDNGDIFISSNINLKESINCLIHEIGHLLCENPDHNRKWLDTCHNIYSLFSYNSNIGNINIGNIAWNIGNITGVQNILLDYHLLQAYRKFSQRILATEGQWEVLGDNKIRLFPTPRGMFPVIVKYIPTVNHWHSPEAREITKRMMLAEAKIMLGNARSKFQGLPGPDGGQITMNGNEMRTEGQEEKKQALEDALLLTQPLPIILW